MTAYRTIHADDEPAAREYLSDILQPHSDLVMEAQCSSGEELLMAIKASPPDVVFLDIDLGDMTAFDVLRALPSINFEVIFTTAYEQYAVHAFELAAVDYLLKPFGSEQLAIAVERFRQRMLSKDDPKTIERLLSNMAAQNPLHQTIALDTVKGLQFVTIEDIVYCQSEGEFTVYFMTNGEQSIVKHHMKYCHKQLSEYGFIKVNQTSLVNKYYVKLFDKRNKILELKGGQRIEVSRHFEKDLLSLWKPL